MIRIAFFFFIILSTACTSKRLYHSQEIGKYRKEYKEKFLNQTDGPLKKSQLADLKFFPIDSTYKLDTEITLLQNEKPLEFKTASGNFAQYLPYAKTVFELDGEKHTLVIYQIVRLMNNPMYKDYLFLPFTDRNSGETTYGGGRYLDFRFKDIKNGRLIIDFNKAYNPYCAYSAGYNCPIPPKSNFVNARINAGEKNYEGEYNY